MYFFENVNNNNLIGYKYIDNLQCLDVNENSACKINAIIFF